MAKKRARNEAQVTISRMIRPHLRMRLGPNKKPSPANATRKAKQSHAPKKEAAVAIYLFCCRRVKSLRCFDLRVGDVKVRGAWDDRPRHMFFGKYLAEHCFQCDDAPPHLVGAHYPSRG